MARLKLGEGKITVLRDKVAQLYSIPKWRVYLEYMSTWGRNAFELDSFVDEARARRFAASVKIVRKP